MASVLKHLTNGTNAGSGTNVTDTVQTLPSGTPFAQVMCTVPPATKWQVSAININYDASASTGYFSLNYIKSGGATPTTLASAILTWNVADSNPTTVDCTKLRGMVMEAGSTLQIINYSSVAFTASCFSIFGVEIT